MYKIVSRLLIYGDMPKDTILMESPISSGRQTTRARPEGTGYQNLYPDQAPASGGDRFALSIKPVAEFI